MWDARWRTAGRAGRWPTGVPKERCGRERLVVCQSEVFIFHSYNTLDLELTWGTDGTKENGIVLLQTLKASLRDVLPGLLVSLGAPVIVGKLKVERLLSLRQSFEYISSCLNDFGADSVRWDGGDAVRPLCRSCAGRHFVYERDGKFRDKFCKLSFPFKSLM